eukprot:4761870-Prymnesium_polylepis.1
MAARPRSQRHGVPARASGARPPRWRGASTAVQPQGVAASRMAPCSVPTRAHHWRRLRAVR